MCSAMLVVCSGKRLSRIAGVVLRIDDLLQLTLVCKQQYMHVRRIAHFALRIAAR